MREANVSCHDAFGKLSPDTDELLIESHLNCFEDFALSTKTGNRQHQLIPEKQ